MSDASQGPGWWLASDGKWYPPQGETAAPTIPEAPPTYLPPGVPPFASPGTPPSQGMPGCLKAGLIVGGILFVVAVLGVVALFFLGRTVSDNVRASVESGRVPDLSKGADDGSTSAPADFCSTFTAVNDATKVGASDDPAEVRDRFADFDDQVDNFEASAPPEISAEAVTTAGVFRDIHQLLIDVDFDGSKITDGDLKTIFTPDRSADVRAVSAHCGQ